MVKATRKCAVLLALLAIGMAVTAMPSYAETQNVKIGGDYTLRGFWRHNLDLHDKDNVAGTNTPSLNNHQYFFQQTVGLNASADLTENVSTFIRLSNENVMGANSTTGTTGTVRVSQSYVKLKDLFYAPLTVTIGRQPIVWGRGFVLGSNLIPGTLLGTGGNTDSQIPANEFTDYTAFDAARATLDFSGGAAVSLPLTVDLVYAKLSEGNIGKVDDVNLMGVNVGTKIDAGNSELETYWLNKRDNAPRVGSATAALNSQKPGNVNTLGIRGSTHPIEGSNIYGELAYQFGQRATDPNLVLPSGTPQQAWAFDLGAEMGFKDVPTSPMIGAEWIFYSGKDVDGGVAGWDPMARGYFTTALREFQNPGFYPPDQTCLNAGGGLNSCTGGATNQHQMSFYGSIKPLEDLKIAPRISWFFTDVGQRPTGGLPGGGSTTVIGKRRSFIGTEFDTVTTYNYTDDVQFGVIYGVFAPGNVYRTPTDSVAQEVVSTVSVKF